MYQNIDDENHEHNAMILGKYTTFIVFTLSLFFGLLVANGSWVTYRESTESTAAILRAEITNQITHNITKAEQSLNQLNALFSTFYTLDENQFLSISEQILKQQPYIRKIAYIPRVTRENLRSFESEMNEQHFVEFKIKEYDSNGKLSKVSGLNDKYYPILYIEPQTVRNVILIGFNVYSIKKFSNSIDQSNLTFETIPLFVNLSSKNKETAEYWILKALYSGFSTPEADELQLKSDSGVLGYSLDMNAILPYLLLKLNFSEFELSFTDHNGKFETVYSFVNTPKESMFDYLSITTGSTLIETQGQKLTLKYKQFLFDNDADRYQLIVIVLSILLIILMITAFSHRIVKGLKHQISLYKKIKINENNLLRAQKIAHLGSWDFDIATDKFKWSAEVFDIFELNSSTVEPSYDVFISSVHPDDRDFVSNSYLDSVKWNSIFDIEYRLLLKENKIKHVHARCETIYGNGNEPISSSGTIHDITTRKLHEEKITHQAHFDSLTGLPNRFLSMDRLSQLLNDAQRHNDKVAVLFLDLDNFKTINDTLGHEVGDNFLIKAAERLLAVIRSGDTVGRFGGDEFIILLGGLNSISGAQPVAEGILSEFRKVFVVDGREFMLTTSIGISVYPDDSDNPSELLRNADSAMYHSKGLGRNIYSYFTENMNSAVSRKLNLEEQLHGALNRGEFSVLYQPKIDISNNRVVGAEALMRWYNPVLGNVSPAEFIPIAEQTGLIVPLGIFVLNEALINACHWKSIYSYEFNIAVNISPVQFRDPGLVQNIKTAINLACIPAKCLELEITEGVLMSGQSYINKAISNLNELGVTIAMDDFGTGYSSLSYLRKYPFDVLKIDRSFVSDITSDQKDRELINATIVMAHALRLKVVAEGVETNEQLKYLKELGCDYAQGYYFNKPLSAEHMCLLLKDCLT